MLYVNRGGPATLVRWGIGMLGHARKATPLVRAILMACGGRFTHQYTGLGAVAGVGKRPFIAIPAGTDGELSTS